MPFSCLGVVVSVPVVALSLFSVRVRELVPLSAPALSRSILDLFRSVLEIRGVSVESEAGSWSVDPPLPDLVFLHLESLNRSFYGYDFYFHLVVLPSSVFPRSSDLFGSGQSGRSAVTPADGLPRADSPARSRWTVRCCLSVMRTVLGGPFTQKRF